MKARGQRPWYSRRYSRLSLSRGFQHLAALLFEARTLIQQLLPVGAREGLRERAESNARVGYRLAQHNLEMTEETRHGRRVEQISVVLQRCPKPLLPNLNIQHKIELAEMLTQRQRAQFESGQLRH